MPDTDDPQKRQEIEDYKRSIVERNKARMASRPKNTMPNLVEAEAMYDMDRDGPTTLAQMAKSQQQMRDGTAPEKPAFSQDTVAGLRALKEHTEAQRAQMPSEPVVAPPKSKEDEEVEDAYEAQSDALKAFDTDVDAIKNEKGRKRIEDLVEPIDITEGLANGVFTQHVPIVPGRFEVTFKTASSEELQRVRLALMKRLDDNPHLEIVAGQLLALMNLVAQIDSVNGKREDPHMIGDSLYSATFDEESFNRKVDKYLRYPGPMVYSMSVHCDWFQERVRTCFTAENLKNG